MEKGTNYCIQVNIVTITSDSVLVLKVAFSLSSNTFIQLSHIIIWSDIKPMDFGFVFCFYALCILCKWLFSPQVFSTQYFTLKKTFCPVFNFSESLLCFYSKTYKCIKKNRSSLKFILWMWVGDGDDQTVAKVTPCTWTCTYFRQMHKNPNPKKPSTRGKVLSIKMMKLSSLESLDNLKTSYSFFTRLLPNVDIGRLKLNRKKQLNIPMTAHATRKDVSGVEALLHFAFSQCSSWRRRISSWGISDNNSWNKTSVRPSI